MSVSANNVSAREEFKRRIDEKLRRELGATVLGLLNDPGVIGIMLNPDGTLWVERFGEAMQQAGVMKPTQAEALMTTVASSLNTVITCDNPILECELPRELPMNGSRFEALIPPVVSAPVFTIRKKAAKVFTLDEYVETGIMTQQQNNLLSNAIKNRKNILIVGGTGSGKTTLTNAVIDTIAKTSPDHRLVIIEDTAEIQCQAKNAVVFRATDHIDMLRLLKATMRMRPDRIIVGEVRGAEALTLLKAWNTGHPGGVCTVHANNALAGLIRLEQLIAEATMAPMHHLIGEAVDVVVFIEKTPDGRRVQDIISVNGFNGEQYDIN